MKNKRATGFMTWPFRGIIALLSALAISFFSAYMSVVGMHALFPAAGGIIIGMMIAIECGKFVTAEITYHDWHRANNGFKRFYMASAVAILMCITAMGVYGYLAKGHLEQQAPLAPIQLQISQGETQIEQLKQQLTGLTAQQTQMNASVDAVIRNSQSARDARSGVRARSSMTKERADIQSKIDGIYKQINDITQKLVPLRMQTTEVTAKLGPIQYIADAFGWKDPETAVRIIIVMLMAAFDPLAIVLLLVGAEKISEWNDTRHGYDDDEVLEIAGPEPETEPEPETTFESLAAEMADAGLELEKEQSCSFCYKTEDEVGELLTAGSGAICSECAKLCGTFFDASREEPEADPELEVSGSMTDVLRDLELRPSEPESIPEPVYGEDMSDDEYEAVLDGDMPVFTPSPEPRSWGHVVDRSMLPFEAPPEGALLPELEKMLQARKDDDKQAFLEILERHPELIEEVVKAAEEAASDEEPIEWLTAPKKPEDE